MLKRSRADHNAARTQGSVERESFWLDENEQDKFGLPCRNEERAVVVVKAKRGTKFLLVTAYSAEICI